MRGKRNWPLLPAPASPARSEAATSIADEEALVSQGWATDCGGGLLSRSIAMDLEATTDTLPMLTNQPGQAQSSSAVALRKEGSAPMPESSIFAGCTRADNVATMTVIFETDLQERLATEKLQKAKTENREIIALAMQNMRDENEADGKASGRHYLLLGDS